MPRSRDRSLLAMRAGEVVSKQDDEERKIFSAGVTHIRANARGIFGSLRDQWRCLIRIAILSGTNLPKFCA